MACLFYHNYANSWIFFIYNNTLVTDYFTHSDLVTSKISVPSEPDVIYVRPYKDEDKDVAALKLTNVLCIPESCENYYEKELVEKELLDFLSHT